MEFITKIFDLNLESLVPEMDVFLKDIRFLVTLAVLVGPVVLLVLGAMYLLKPAPEANYKYGFRTYYGMGGVEAWRFSQRIAGIAFAGLGAVLLIVMIVVAVGFKSKDLFQMTTAAMVCLLWQTGLALAARITVAVLSAHFFDRNGRRRK